MTDPFATNGTLGAKHFDTDDIVKTSMISQIERLRAENERFKRELACAKDMATWEANRAYYAVLDCNELVIDNNTLRQAMHDIYEVYAGCDGNLHNTSHSYLMQLIKEMADIAAEHKRVAGGDND